MLPLTSCAPDGTTSAQLDQKTQAQLREMERKLDAQSAALARFEQSTTEALDKKVTTMGQSLAELFSKLDTDVRSQVSTLRQSFYGEKTAVLDPTTKGYASVSTDKGVFLFSVADASPFLDGHKIVVEIGNPMNVTFSGFKLKIRYGRRPPAFPSFELSDTNATVALKKWVEDKQAWDAGIRKTEVSFTEDLVPGTWTKVDFTLKETKPEDVAYIEVGIETDRLSLRRPLK